MWILEEQVIAEIRERFLFLVLLPLIDVYKRQGYDRRFLSEEAAGWAAEVMAGQGILCRIIHRESPTPLIMYTAVSYTHLDVYKRQPPGSAYTL